jgi:alpha-L-fucosidase 2
LQKNHRNVSHLYGHYPERQITESSPGLLAAAKRSLELRGDEGTGWSRACKICLWAWLRNGNHA